MQPQIDDDELVRRFTSHPVGEAGQLNMLEIRGAAAGFASEVLSVTPPGREQSLAITKIEEAVFWANAALARGIGQADVPLKAAGQALHSEESIRRRLTHSDLPLPPDPPYRVPTGAGARP